LKTGIVIKSTGSNYQVKIDNDIVDCKIKGNFRLKDIRTTNPLAVGDIVDVDTDEYNVIVKIHDRKNYIIRKSINLSKQAQIIAANVDQALLLVTLKQPSTSPVFIDRFLVSSEAYHIPVNIIFNKIDLYNETLLAQLDELENIYSSLGYPCFRVSVKTNTNIDLVRELLQNKVSVISGNSGVGKSSLIQTIDLNLKLRTGEISSYHHKGKHTTTFAEMFPLSFGGMIIDTPGIKGFGMIDFENENIANYFREMLNLLQHCEFYNCTHTHEPGCAVKKAVEEGNVSHSRYKSYLSMLDDEDVKYRKDF